MREDIKLNLLNKKAFVANLATAILPVQTNIVSIDYDVLVSKKNSDWYDEYLVINYKGGAKTARCCNGNSCSAIYQELGRFLTTWGGGADIEYYNGILADKDRL